MKAALERPQSRPPQLAAGRPRPASLETAVSERSAGAAVYCDPSLNIRSWPEAARTIFGFSFEDAIGRNLFRTVGGPAAAARTDDVVERIATRRAGLTLPMHAWTKAGEIVQCDWTIAPIYLSDGDLEGFAATVRAVGHECAVETGTADRSALRFQDRVDAAVRLAERCHFGIAVLAVCIEGGRAAAEAELLSSLRQGDAAARLTADAWGVLLAPVDGHAGALTAAHRLLRGWNRSARRTERRIPRVGIAVYPDDGTDAISLIDRSQLALAQACALKQDVIAFGETEAANQRSRCAARDLQRGIDHHELELLFQPEMSLRDGSLAAVRALMHWPRASGKNVAHAGLVELARRTGLAPALGCWMLSAVCATMREWSDEGVHVPRVHVDVLDGHAQRRLVDDVASVLCESDVDPAALELELHPGPSREGLASVTWLLEELRPLGVRRAISDGLLNYAAVRSLESIGIDAVVIDAQCIADCLERPSAGAAVRATVDVARAMQVDVIADGVHAPEQAMFLRSAGCDRARGRFVGEALRPAELGRVASAGFGFAPTA